MSPGETFRLGYFLTFQSEPPGVPVKLSSILLHYFVRDLSLATFPVLVLFGGFSVSIWLLSRQSSSALSTPQQLLVDHWQFGGILPDSQQLCHDPKENYRALYHLENKTSGDKESPWKSPLLYLTGVLLTTFPTVLNSSTLAKPNQTKPKGGGAVSTVYCWINQSV